jgi:sugar O-acyltransferase (sialic acid O-acetyltransferase NeuD family)
LKKEIIRIVVMGAGGTTADVLSIVGDINRARRRYECVGILDDDPKLWGKERFGVKVLGGLERASTLRGVRFVNCLGSPKNFWLRETALSRLGLSPSRFETLIHPSAVVSQQSLIGRGTILYPNVVVMANARLGNHVTVLANTVINHDAVIGDLCIITSGVNVSGRVRIGRCSYIGSGATLVQDLTIGEYALVGMGSVVRHAVAPRTIVVGNPARYLRDIDQIE